MQKWRFYLVAQWVCLFMGLAVLGAKAQVPAWANRPPPTFPAKIFSIEPANETDIRINFFIEAAGSYKIQARAEEKGSPKIIGTGTVARAGVYSWTDVGMLKSPGHRFYSIGVSLPHSPHGTSDRWALYVQSRVPGHRYLVSIPVDVGPDPSLQAAIGKQLMFGLGGGATTNDSDELRVMTAPGVWESAYLIKDKQGELQWRASDTKTPSTLAVRPAHAFWVVRRSAVPHVTKRGIIAGPIPTRGQVPPITFGLDGDGITPFGVAHQRPLVHRNTEAQKKHSTRANQLGFYKRGSAGATADLRRKDELGDQIWVWHDNEWLGRHWLMGHLGEHWDGRWWDPKTNDFSNFMLEPGIGYYYIHRTNRWGGAEFQWRP